MLAKLTEKGRTDIKGIAERIKQGSATTGQTLRESGGKSLGTWATMGEYDFVAVTQFPSDEAATEFSLRIAAIGNLNMHTLRAYDPEEFLRIASKLP
jgi:uncharacterized protein with GYD domain